MAVRLYFAGLIALIIFLGCGGGGGGGAGLSPVGPTSSGGRIFGTIEMDQAVAAMRPEGSSVAASQRFLDSFITLEELPTVSTRADADGKFFFDNLPVGSYRVLARVTSLTGREYKARAAPVNLSQAQLEQSSSVRFTAGDLAEYQIRLLVKDLSGNPVGKCRVWFWGEQFTLDAGGYYLSPTMPAGAIGVIKVEPPADKGLSRFDFTLPEDTFKSDNLAILGVTLPTSGIANKAPMVSISTGQHPSGGSAFLRLYGHASDPEGEPMVTSWKASVSTFSYVAQTYADWAVPSTAASVTVYFSASEDGRRYPRLTSTAHLTINIASTGAVTFPGEIFLPPVTRTVAIIGSATSQIAGNATTLFEARPDFPPGLALTYSWSIDRGTVLSGATGTTFLWKSPALNPGLTQIANLKLLVSDGIATATGELQIRITSAPIVEIEQPHEVYFEPGLISFSGRARDFLNSSIAPEYLRWFVATGTSDFKLLKSGSTDFAYNFVAQGSYTVALECTDINSVIGTATKLVQIVNSRPVCTITGPANDASYQRNTPVTFTGTAVDAEDGVITSAAALSWRSDLDGLIGSGTRLTMPSLSSGRHAITFSAVDNNGAVGSASIVVWYDVPARITFSPASLSVMFAGNPLTFIATGTDSDNSPLDASQFKWYLNNLPEIWREGQTFTLLPGSIAPGVYRVHVEGTGRFGPVVSPTQIFQTGWPVASISSPASGTRFEPGNQVTFIGVPDSTGSLALEWSINGTRFGSGSTVSYSPANGRHQINYVGTDSLGFVSSSSISIVVERPPVVSFVPTTGAYLFAGRNVSFSASCIDTNNVNIPDSRVAWLLEGAPWKTGTVFQVAQGGLSGQLAAGSHQISLVAVGPYGTMNSITNTVTTGVPVARILSPANNATFNTGTNIPFSGEPDSVGPINMEWWSNYGTPGALKLGEGAAFSSAALPEGYHEISYFGHDSSGYISSHSIHVSIGEFPQMDFTPADGSVFFAGHDVTFAGVGTDTLSGTAIPGNRMSWYIDGSLELASYSVFPLADGRIHSLGEGTKLVELRGVNAVGAVGTVIKNIYLGLQNATISFPIADSVIPPDTMFNLSGAPDSTGPVVMQWWLNHGQPGATLLGTGQSINTSLPYGEYYVTYLGTDSAGVGSSARIRIIISDSPSLSFAPPDGSRLFVGQPFTLNAVGADDPADVNWFLDGGPAVWKSGSPALVSAGQLAVGSHQITAEGPNALGVLGSITNTIFYGETLATITVPASGSHYAIGTPVDFAATPVPVAPVSMAWYRDDGGAPVYMGNTAALNDYPLPPGLHTITYIGTDSAGYVSSADIQVLMNDAPPLAITPGDNSMFFAGRSVTFTGSGTSVINGLAIAGSTMKWYLDGSNSGKTGSSATWTQAQQGVAGPHVLRVDGTDEYGTDGQSPTINIKFGHAIASITAPASGTRFNLGEPVFFAGSPDSEGVITMEWYRDGDPVAFAAGANPAGQTFPAGRQTIRYRGTDSSGYVSSAAIQILVNNLPTMEVLPGDSSIFFAGRSVTLIGSGTTSSGQPVATASMRWFVDGNAASSYSGSPITIAATAYAAGVHTFRLEGVDEYGVKGDTVISFEFRYPQAAISAPASGTRFEPAEAITFTGSPGSSGPITMEWMREDGVNPPVSLGFNSNPAPLALPPGRHTIRYVGTDSASFASSATIQLLVNSTPAMNFTPGEGSVFFTGRQVTLIGSGTSYGGLPVATASLKWFVNGIQRATSSPATFNVGILANGVNTIRLEGTDEFGTVGSISQSIYYGMALPAISAPASGTRFDPVDLVTFTGTPASNGPVTMEWMREDGINPPVSLGFDSAPAPLTLPPGRHVIRYVGTDSANFAASTTIQLLVNSTPAMNFTPGEGSVFFTGRAVGMVGSGTSYGGLPVATASLKWFVNGTQRATSSPATFTVGILANGANTVRLEGTDEFGTVGSISQSVTYGLALPSISSPASGTTFDPADLITFTGSPGSTGPVTMQWLREDGINPPVSLGFDSSPAPLSLPAGRHTIRYIGTDTASFGASTTIQILVNRVPTMDFTPGEGSMFFTGRTVSLIGSGTSHAGLPIASATMKWFVNGTQQATNSPGTFNVGILANGVNTIRVEGTDEFGTVGSRSHSIYYGVAMPSITAPASGTSYQTVNNINFTATPAATLPYINPQWLLNGTNFASGYSANIVNLAPGLQTIQYVASDSSGYVSTATIQLLVNDQPALDFTPGNGSRFFTGTTVSFTGIGTGSIGSYNIPTANMKWYLDGAGAPTRTDSPAVFTSGQLSAANHTLKLEGADQFGTIGSRTYSFNYGLALAAISVPGSGTQYNIGSNVTLTGTPDTTAPVTMSWYLDYGLPGETLLGNGGSLVQNFPTRGIQTITYLGTDSGGYTSSKTVQILVNASPTMTITAPTNNSSFFGNQIISFAGSGLNAAAGPINAAQLTWYRNGVSWKTATSNFLATVADLPTGTFQIRLNGVDEFGTVGSVTHNIRTGVDLPTISSPASGTRFDTGSSVSFTGNDLTGLINTEWYWQEGATVFGNGPSASIATMSRGVQTVTYRGTDSMGTTRSKTIQVLIDKLPVFIVKPFISSPVKFGNGPVFGGNAIPIHIASAGTQVVFSVTAEDEPGNVIPSAQVTWYEGMTLLGNVATMTRIFENPGSYTYLVSVEDEYTQVSTASITFWVWDTETYFSGSLSSPGVIVNNGDTVVYVTDPGSGRILKLNRKTTGLTESGDLDSILAQSSPASMTHSFVDLVVSGASLFTLGENAGVDYKIQKWDANTLNSQTPEFLKLHGTASNEFMGPRGIAVDGAAIYVADFGNNRIKKLDITNGNFFSESQNVVNPYGLKYINPTNLYVAENGQNQLLKFNSDLNSVATWDSQTVNNPAHFAYSAGTGNIYTTDPTPGAPRVNVVASSGLILYSFGKNGTTPNRGEFASPLGIVIIGTDIYVTDNIGNSIVRFRSGGW